MTEIFPYSEFTIAADSPPSNAFPNEHVLSIPLIDLRLRLGSKTTNILKALVDSGAAYSVFGRDTAKLLDLKVKSGKRKKDVAGIGGGVDLYFATVDLIINSITLQAYVGFMDQDFPGQEFYIGLLGCHDFLNKALVALDIDQNQIRIG